MPVVIELTGDEMRFAHETAVEVTRRRSSQQHHGTVLYDEETNIRWHEIGILAELAVGKWRRVKPGSFTEYDPARSDVDGLQVKATRPNLNLLVKKTDLDHHPLDRPYLLAWVTVGDPDIRLVGWAPLGDITTPDRWWPEMDVFKMPHQNLRPIMRLSR